MNSEIKVSRLEKSYPHGVRALKGIDFEIPKGCFFTLLGPNGAGKSTLIRILTTLIAQDGGTFSIGGLDPKDESIGLRRYIGVASQENELDPSRTPESLLAFQGRLFNMSKRQASQRAGELMEMFRLTEEGRKKAGALSGGNKRRLHCALALVHEPRVLFLDEPTVGMDPVARATFWQVITGLNKNEGITVFLTTQYLEEADRHATDMALIIDGGIHFSGTLESFKKRVNMDRNLSLEESYVAFVEAHAEACDE